MGIFIVLFSCDKDSIKTYDYRDVVIGNYKGTRVNTFWVDSQVGVSHDTSDIILTLAKSDLDSIIDVSFNPDYWNAGFSFKFAKDRFLSTTNYHPPILTLVGDSLYFRHQPGLGPLWTECFTKKIK